MYLLIKPVLILSAFKRINRISLYNSIYYKYTSLFLTLQISYVAAWTKTNDKLEPKENIG